MFKTGIGASAKTQPHIDLSGKTKLILEGGGVKGAAFGGAIDYLEQCAILERISHIGGSSAGGITAFLLAGGLKAQGVKDIIQGLDFNQFKDDSWGIVRDLHRLNTQYGFHKGEVFMNWAETMAEKLFGSKDATFADLNSLIAQGKTQYKHLYLTGCNITDMRSEVFSFKTTPHMRLADALRCTMSLPGFFVPHTVNGKMYVDGGLTRNYPIRLFDKVFDRPEGGKTRVPDDSVIGFRLDTSDEIQILREHAAKAGTDPDGFMDFLGRIMSMMGSVQDQDFSDQYRTIFIDTLNVKTTDFGIGAEDKKRLCDSGFQACCHACGPVPAMGEKVKIPRYTPRFQQSTEPKSKTPATARKKAPPKKDDSCRLS